MPESLCRLTVQLGGGDAQDAVDLALPGKTQVGQLMPSIVDIVHSDGVARLTGGGWRLSRVGGAPLDESKTLAENEIHDGALLILTDNDPPHLDWMIGDPSHVVAQADPASDGAALWILPVVCGVSMAGVSAAALVWPSAVATTAGQPVTGAGLAFAAAVGAVTARRIHTEPLLSVTLSVAAVGFAAVAGYLAVPAGQPAAHALLASAAAFCVAILLKHLMNCGTICLTAIATLTVLTAGVAAGGVAWHLPADAAGASLATLSLATLAVAPRISIAVTGVGPSPPGVDDVAGPATDVVTAAAVRAHQTLTGMVIGASGATAIGAALVACAGLREDGSPLSAAVLTAVIGLVLLLRVRTHVEVTRRIALAVGGMIGVAACFALGVVSVPEQAHWISVLGAAAGVGALTPLFGLAATPVARRAVEVVEYLALAAVVPVACWVGGLYGLVRDSGLA